MMPFRKHAIMTKKNTADEDFTNLRHSLVHRWEAVYRMSVLDAIEILGIVKQYAENIAMFPDAIEKSKRVMNTLEVGLKEANNSKGGETQQMVVENLKESLRRYKETLKKIANKPIRCRLQPQKYSSKIEDHVSDVGRQIPFLNISVLQKANEIERNSRWSW